MRLGIKTQILPPRANQTELQFEIKEQLAKLDAK